MLGREVFEYDSARILVFTVDLPIAGQVTRASFRGALSGLQAGPSTLRGLWSLLPVSIRSALKPSDRGLFVGH